ncbi:hypothetical protein LY01_02702 [Nonlabens xylanidelens]|uniref:Uncharacterized protein n=1 Tax=Nonlabens xylanidelens TaxID=191564 RepID=A0A2S6IFM2_9FLAO|nr:hypothetical protein [Nonlabens xylanidelens]PPK92997.1 hypothetical protein LY01_02702 [Nonlabens xylanidelens]PQJ18793.1 hypothetical protein BST94_07190 [Nonlabens xylanidelens]
MKLPNKLTASCRLSIQFALASFALGTLILGLYLITANNVFAVLGFGFLVIAVPFNSLILLSVFIQLLTGKLSIKEFFFSSYVLLLNVPIALFYFHIVTTYTRL